MKKITKQLLIWTLLVIGFGVIGYVGFVGSMVIDREDGENSFCLSW